MGISPDVKVGHVVGWGEAHGVLQARTNSNLFGGHSILKLSSNKHATAACLCLFPDLSQKRKIYIPYMNLTQLMGVLMGINLPHYNFTSNAHTHTQGGELLLPWARPWASMLYHHYCWTTKESSAPSAELPRQDSTSKCLASTDILWYLGCTWQIGILLDLAPLSTSRLPSLSHRHGDIKLWLSIIII